MANAAVRVLLRSLHSIVGGVVVSADPAPAPYPTLVAMTGNHPVPGSRSFAAATKIVEVTAGRRVGDIAIVLLSGGTSSLIGAPLAGMNGADLSQLYEQLLGAGLDIRSMNVVRKRFSRWSAGRLALALAPAATHCFAVSDVDDDDLTAIGSGPCSPDASTAGDVRAILERANLLARIPQAHRDYLAAAGRGAVPETPKKTHPAFAHVSARVISGNRVAVEAAADAARQHGAIVEVVAERLAGEASVAGEQIATELIERRRRATDSSGRPRCVIWGGETIVSLGASSRHTDGGRCQELALAAARALSGSGEAASGIALLAAGTDGRDGATDAAGAFVDATTWRTIGDSGVDAERSLASHASHAALAAANALMPRFESGTNVNDLVIGWV